jgi:hypothetical protein
MLNAGITGAEKKIIQPAKEKKIKFLLTVDKFS